MKRKLTIVSCILAVLMLSVLALTACTNTLGSDKGTDATSSAGDTLNITINTPDVQDYATVNENNVTELVAEVGMTSTYELSAEIYYTYSVFGRTFNGNSSGKATAFAINEDGYLITNAHCVTVDLSSTYPNATNLTYTSRKVYVNLADSDIKMPCDIIAYNETLDLALIKIQDSGTLYDGSKYTLEKIPYSVFFNHQDPSQEGSTLTLNYGESVIAIGNAKGYGISITTGVVSAPLRQFTEESESGEEFITKAIQTDATINPGNSGGPLFNQYCAVVGVNTFKIVEEEVENIGFAVPSYVVIDFINELKDGSYDKTLTMGADGNAFSSTVNVVYYTTTERAYSSTGANVTRNA